MFKAQLLFIWIATNAKVGKVKSSIIFFFLSLLLVSNLSAQSAGCREGATFDRRELVPEFLEWRTDQANVSNFEVIEIPLVFQRVEGNTNRLSEMIFKLNQAFANRGDFFTEYGKDAKIRFCIAKTTPDGGLSSGINNVRSLYGRFDMDLEVPDLINLIKWDQRRYINIWLVDDIRGELAGYSGERWWARIPPAGFVTRHGIILDMLNADALIGMMGSYFELLPTSSSSCKNDNCWYDGDMICDTPPDESTRISCGDNSCDTDTLSNYSNGNFYSDTLDMNSNFMDVSGCPTDFSHDQIDWMRFFIGKQ